MWRCFYEISARTSGAYVCSTHVEMFPKRVNEVFATQRLLHACGDVSKIYITCLTEGAFAPRMWRCFYLIFKNKKLPLGLLHACGDVSYVAEIGRDFSTFAPRMWRCFLRFFSWWYKALVCSTHVEMFPRLRQNLLVLFGLLHACGDVSDASAKRQYLMLFAPRMWRCF